MLFPDAVRWSREQRGWSQTDLAREADLSKSTISRIERGQLTPSADVAGRIAWALRWNARELFVALVCRGPDA